MFTGKYSILFVFMAISVRKSTSPNGSVTQQTRLSLRLVLLWCTVQPSSAESTEEDRHLIDSTDEDHSLEDFLELYRRASLRPVVLQQRASLRPFAGKRASLRPYAGKRASLRPAHYMGKRKRRHVLFDEE